MAILFCILHNVHGFGLLATNYGCPNPEMYKWELGKLTMNVQDQSFHWSENLDLLGPRTDNEITLQFCILSEENKSDPTLSTADNINNTSYCVWRTTDKCPVGKCTTKF